MDTQKQNPFASSGLFVNTADVWTPYKMSFEGFAGGGKTLTMCLVALGLWEAQNKAVNVLLQDTERSAKFIVPFFRPYGLIEGRNLFITHSRKLQTWGKILELAEKERGTIFMTDTVTHLYEDMIGEFEATEKRKVKYPQDAMRIKPMWKEKFSTPFLHSNNCHLLFTGRAAFEYTMQIDEDTGKKEFNATGVKMRGDNELAYEPDVVVLMERVQQQADDGVWETARRATIMKDRSRLIDGHVFIFPPTDQWKERENKVWEVFKPVYEILAAGAKEESKPGSGEQNLGPLFVKGQGEAWYQQKLRAERLVDEIGRVYEQWGLGGTGSMERSVRSILYKIIFDQRSTIALAEMPPEELQRGLEVIEYMCRYVAKNVEIVAKMYKANEFENVNVYLAEEIGRYRAVNKEMEGGRREAGGERQDEIPFFDSETEHTGPEKPAVGNGSEQVAVETVIESFKEARDLGEIEALEENYRGVIGKMGPADRNRVLKVRNDRAVEIGSKGKVQRARAQRARA